LVESDARRLAREVPLDADLIERHLAITVEVLLRRHPAPRLVVVDLPEAFARDGDPVDVALQPDLALFREGEHHAALDGHGALAVELVWHYLAHDLELRSRREPEALRRLADKTLALIETTRRARRAQLTFTRGWRKAGHSGYYLP